MIQHGLIHCHSEHSLKDSAMHITSLVNTAKEMGAKAVALTDHGTMTGIVSFMDACKEAGINGIPGVEAYVDDDDGLGRKHLILLAKDYEGYIQISRAVTLSNAHLDSKGFPCMSKAILEEVFSGTTHVIATSACVLGILSKILLKNNIHKEQIERLKSRQERYLDPQDEAYNYNKNLLIETDEKIQALMNEKPAVEKLAKRPFKKRESVLAKFTEGTEEYITCKKELDADKKESGQAQIRLDEIKKELKKLRTNRTLINKKVKEADTQAAKFIEIEEEIESIKSQISNKKEIEAQIEAELSFYTNLFKDNFYIEVQNHRMEDEKYVYPILARIAKRHNLPLVATNDVHQERREDTMARAIMKSLRFNKWSDVTNTDYELYIKSDEELRSILSEILYETDVDKAMQGIGDICETCHVVFPDEKHYPVFIGENGPVDSIKEIKKQAFLGISKKFKEGEFSKKYQERLAYETEVICSLGYADYLLIVADFLKFARQKATENPERIGLYTGPGRGSACGSLLCYLLDITNIDPLKYDLLFERFLNKERVSMPDIDSDFAPEVRDETIEYVKKKYGEGGVACIRTTQTQGARNSIRNCARILGSKKFDDTRTFLDLADNMAKMIPETPGVRLSDHYDEIKKAFAKDKDAIEILDTALLVEGTITGLGLHAAGVIISDNGDVSQYTPLLFNKGKNQWAVQCDMVESENIGLLKMDFLGLRNLSIISDCIRRVKRNKGVTVDMQNLPFEREVFDNIFSAGNTNGVFQFESNGMKDMLKRFKPTCIEDIILLVAAYRPGPMQYLDEIIATKNGKTPRYVIPDMEEILGTTYGKPIYQEQVMQIFNRFAGFSLGESDIIRRFMSKKKTDKFLAYKDKFIKGFMEHGATQIDAEDFWEQLVSFSEYAFNKSHAAAYAMVAYYTAYLKYHYPAEYFCSLLTFTANDKLAPLLADATKNGLTIRVPNVNRSFAGFINEGKIITFGLSSVKGVASFADAVVEERIDEGVFMSFNDFVARTMPSSDTLTALIRAGALDKFGHTRNAMLECVVPLLDKLKKLRSKEKDRKEIEASLQMATTKKEKEKLSLRMKNANKTMLKLRADVEKIVPSKAFKDNPLKKLLAEKEVLGAFVSAHPLDSYTCVNKNVTPIAEIRENTNVIYGMVKDVRETKRKSDNAPMMFFTLEDKTGEIPVCLFTKAYPKYHGYVNENAVIEITGNVLVDDSKDTPVQKFSVGFVNKVKPDREEMICHVPTTAYFNKEVAPVVEGLLDNAGYKLFVHSEQTGALYPTKKIVSHSLLNAEIPFTDFQLVD